MFIKRGIKKIVTEYIEYNDKYKKLFGDKAIVLMRSWIISRMLLY